VVVLQDAANRLDPEQSLVRIDVSDDHFKRRSSSAAAKNALAVLRISFARISSATSLRKALISSRSALVTPGFSLASTRARSTQPRIVSIGIPVKSCRCRSDARIDSPGTSCRRSKNIRMTRSFVSWSYLARMPHSLLSRGRRASIKARAARSARSRLELVSLIERLRRVGLPVAVACAVAGVSRASYYRWRYRLRRGGARALTDGRSRNRRRRAAPVRSAVRPLVEELR